MKMQKANKYVLRDRFRQFGEAKGPMHVLPVYFTGQRIGVHFIPFSDDLQALYGWPR